MQYDLSTNNFVIVSRVNKDDSFSLLTRVNMINDSKADFLISIHCNASEMNIDARGYNIFYHDNSFFLIPIYFH